MLRAVSVICTESQALLLLSPARRDIYKLFRKSTFATNAPSSQTVLTSDSRGDGKQAVAAESSCQSPLPPPPPTPPPPRAPRQAWTAAAAALAITASIGGIYFYRKISDDEKKPIPSDVTPKDSGKDKELPIPPSADSIPRHVQFLLVGAGTASFAAMRAIRSNKPDSQVLIVGNEMQLPYMRPPLSKELWREPDLHSATDLDSLTFRQWNGRTRSVSYEPKAFYTPVEELARDDAAAERKEAEGAAEGEREAAVRRVGGTGVARGWTVTRIDPLRHEARLEAPHAGSVTITYDKCLIATGVGAASVAALGAARAAGAALRVRGLRDVQRLAQALQPERVRRVAVVGGGFLATELSASLADKFRDSKKSVVQVYREGAPLEAVLPPYLAAEAARRLQDAGVTLLPNSDIVEGEMEDNKVRMRMASGVTVDADIVVECVGSEFDTKLADASNLEVHPELGGYLVNAELQARSDVWVAGDAACFYAGALGRRRVAHHDHAVASGRRAGENMLGRAQPYDHQSMFWSDLGPHLGYEAIGIIDSRLPTVGVFCADAVTSATTAVTTATDATAGDMTHNSELDKGSSEPEKRSSEPDMTVAKTTIALPDDNDATSRRYERGVVFYLREKRVVGVLLWNLFNRMHVARQVMAQGEFDDLFEVAKLFSLHEDE